MRLYTFVNGLYMRPIQFGIQSAHLVGDMFVKYRANGEGKLGQLYDWAENHKTMVILSAVNTAGLHGAFAFLDNADNPYPYAKFHEDAQSLDGAITCVGVVVPEKIYTASSDLRYNRNGEYNPETETLKVVQKDDSLRYAWNEYSLTPYEMMLCQKLNEFGLAS